MASIHVSPGVYTKEQDFSVFASRVGITRLGLVGTTLKGPAFEPIKISNADNFLLRFGTTSSDHPLSYVANAFLSQSNELTVTRVLGRGGFTNSPAWLIIADVNPSYSGTVTTSGLTLTAGGFLTSTTYTFTLSASSVGPAGVTATTVSNDTYVGFNSATSAQLASALSAGTFGTYGVTIGAGDSTALSASTFNLEVTTLEPKGAKSGATLAVLRSKRNQVSGSFYYQNESDIKIGAITSTLGAFMLSATTGPMTATTNSGYTVSLDETRSDYIANAFGRDPLIQTDAPNLYVEKIYPHFIREAASRGDIKNLHYKLVYANDAAHTDFGDDFTNSITPWIVSRVMGGEVKNLFKIHTISDGDSSAREIKISFENIDINNYTFDLVVRNFNDTDATVNQSALERFSNVSLNRDATNFVGKVVGTLDKSFPRRSNFILVEMAASYPSSTVPAGFRGYSLRNSALSGETCADIYYKTTYLSGDTIFKTYLGISELGYTSLTQNQISVRNSVKSIEADLFNFDGASATGTTTIKGFHMENLADSTYFVTGNKNSLTAYTNDAGTLLDRKKLKFTVAPAGGFDGWDKYRTYENHYEQFEPFLTSNVDVFKEAIDTFANPEKVDINVFATPGIDFSNNEALVRYALDTIENRADTIYIIDSPRVSTTDVEGTVDEVVSNLESTGFDSSYAATYWPWIQISDPNTGKYSFQSPTLMVVQSIAYTDNVTAPWWAPAGQNRGFSANYVIKADVKLDQADRDTLYQGHINPIADFVQQGVTIMGQKTLQTYESALDRINVRRLLLQVRRLISAAALTLLFEQNDQTTRDQFLAKVQPLLLQIQNQRGLTAFKIVMDDPNSSMAEPNTLVGKIMIKPSRSLEFIDLTFAIFPQGASFDV